MFSRSNHHQRRQRANSLGPSLGTRRRRSPDTTPPESEGDEAGAAHYTKSPHTRRTVKRGRTTNALAGGPSIPQFPQFLPPHSPQSPTPYRLPTMGQLAESLHPTTPPPVPPEDIVMDQVKHLEGLLDSVLATLVIIQAASNTDIALSEHSRHALKVVNSLLQPKSNVDISCPTDQIPSTLANHQKKSYADVTKHCHAAQKATHPERSSPAGPSVHHRSSNTVNKRPPRPSRHHHSSSRVIARWDVQVPQASTSLSLFVRDLNDELDSLLRPKGRIGGEVTRRVLAANITKLGNLVIHTMDDVVALEIQRHPKLVNSCAKAIPDFECPSDPPALDMDVPWYGVVVHDLPARSLVDSFDAAEPFNSIWTLLENEGGVARKDVRGNIRVLCRDGEEFEKESLSMLIRFEDQRVPDRLL